MCLPITRPQGLPPSSLRVTQPDSAPIPSEPQPVAPPDKPTPGEYEGPQDSYHIPVLKYACADTVQGQSPGCEAAFSRRQATRDAYPSNDNTEVLDLTSEQGVRQFLNTYVQVDQERAQDPQRRDQAERQCATSCVVAAYLVADQEKGLGKLAEITQERLTKLAKTRGAISESARPILKDSLPFLQGLQQRVKENKVTRGDVERLQEILSTVINETQALDGMKEDHGLLFPEVTQFFEGTDFKAMLAQHGLEIMGVADHAVLKIKGTAVFDPFPQQDGQQFTENPWHISRYNHSQSRQIDMYGETSSRIK